MYENILICLTCLKISRSYFYVSDIQSYLITFTIV